MKREEISKIVANKKKEEKGFSDKIWIEDGQRLVKYVDIICPWGDIMEYTSSIMLKILNIQAPTVKLGYDTQKGKKCSIINNFLEKEESIIPIDTSWIQQKSFTEEKEIRNSFNKVFQKFKSLERITEENLDFLKKQYIRMIFGDCIIDNEDRPLKNVEVIYNNKTKNYRLSPSFDNEHAFNSYFHKLESPHCYIGNQCFPAHSIVSYIKNHYPNEVEDIIQNLDLLSEKIDELLDPFEGEIPINSIKKHIEKIMQTIYQKAKQSKRR